MRTSATFLAAFVLAIALPAAWLRSAAAQETIVMERDAGVSVPPGATLPPDDGLIEAPGPCECRDAQAPPWHGSVCGDPCGPSCPPPTLFHADPRGQLWMKHHAVHQGCMPPPCFPRMHARLTTGWWPTPRPICLPRCPRCGAHLESVY